MTATPAAAASASASAPATSVDDGSRRRGEEGCEGGGGVSDEEALCILQYVKQAYGLLTSVEQVMWGPILDEPTFTSIERQRRAVYDMLLANYPQLRRLDRQVARRWARDNALRRKRSADAEERETAAAATAATETATATATVKERSAKAKAKAKEGGEEEEKDNERAVRRRRSGTSARA